MSSLFPNRIKQEFVRENHPSSPCLHLRDTIRSNWPGTTRALFNVLRNNSDPANTYQHLMQLIQNIHERHDSMYFYDTLMAYLIEVSKVQMKDSDEPGLARVMLFDLMHNWIRKEYTLQSPLPRQFIFELVLAYTRYLIKANQELSSSRKH